MHLLYGPQFAHKRFSFWACVGSQKHKPEPHRSRPGCSSDSERDCALHTHSELYCVNSSSSTGLILRTKKDIENEPFIY